MDTVVEDLLHRFDVWTLLECHAVSLAALSPTRDVRPLRSVFPELNRQVVAPRDAVHWQRLELRLHRAIAEQSGNPLLGSLLEDLGTQIELVCARHMPHPIHRPGTLWLLQCQHRNIVSCIEHGDAQQAVTQTRAHLHLIRDQLLAALNATHCGVGLG